MTVQQGSDKMSTSAAALAAWAQVGAALLQAILSAGVVLLAWRLQKQFFVDREKTAWRRRVESAANVAIYSLEIYRRLQKRAREAKQGGDKRDVVRKAELDQISSVLSQIDVGELNDEILGVAVMEFRTRWQHAADVLLAEWSGSISDLLIDADQKARQHEVEIFNKAADVERRAAQLLGRMPREDRLPRT